MRRRLLLVTSAAALAALVACAADGEAVSFEPAGGDGGTQIPETAPPIEEDAATPRPDASVSSACNDHGWCETELPDPDLTLFDVWPFEKRAFAIAQSETLGTKLLEWTEATSKWVYIDDNSQNTYRTGHYTGKMFAPSENEVYFITAPGVVFHGKRANPQAPFTWDSARLPYDGPVYPDRDPGLAWRDSPRVAPRRFAYALGVFGTSNDDVYAWFGNRIFHRASVDGAAPTWVPEFVAQDPDISEDESFYIFNAAKGEGDEIWFVGGRGTYGQFGYEGCPTLYRRTAAGYSAVINGSIANFECYGLEGTLDPTWWIDDGEELPFAAPSSVFGWATGAIPVGAGQAVLLLDSDDYYFYYVDLEGDLARLNSIQSVTPPSMGPPIHHSGVRLGDRMWISGQGTAFSSEINKPAWESSFGIGKVGDFEPGATGALLEMSSVAMKSYLNEPLYQVRGTSANNLWIVGNRYALHKKTP
ncbi:MAG: hypothetical protein KF764_28680 [Labilithrix sp.]|nr:hypothetical protein [Labilithrix sp.]